MSFFASDLAAKVLLFSEKQRITDVKIQKSAQKRFHNARNAGIRNAQRRNLSFFQERGGFYAGCKKKKKILLHFPRFFVARFTAFVACGERTLQEFSAFLYIKAVWEIEDFLGSCLGKRQSRATDWQPFLRPVGSGKAERSIPHSAMKCIQCARPMVASSIS